MSQNVASWQLPMVSGRELLRSALLDPLLINVALIASLTATFTVSDAFETSSLGLSHSVLLWTIVSMLMVLQTCVAHRVFLSLLSSTQVARIMAASLALATTAVLMAVELHWLKYTPLLPKEPDPLLEFILFMAQPVLAVGCLTLVAQSSAIQSYVDFLEQRAKTRMAENGESEELSRVLHEEQVLRVSAQDHYLEIVCSEGKYLLRGRLRDALVLLAEHNGAQVHRSHWVASQHIQKVVNEGRDTRLLLTDGSELPVARSRVQLIRQLCS